MIHQVKEQESIWIIGIIYYDSQNLMDDGLLLPMR